LNVRVVSTAGWVDPHPSPKPACRVLIVPGGNLKPDLGYVMMEGDTPSPYDLILWVKPLRRDDPFDPD
jgi:hypothetical protein